MKYDVSFCVCVCVFAAHFAEGSTRRPYAGKWRLPAHTHAPTHLHTVSAVCHLCIQYVCDSPSLSVKVYLCEPVILVAFVTLFSRGVCVSCLIKVNPCEAAGAPFLSTPPPLFLSLLPSSLHSSTLLSLHPCSPSSWHSDSTGEYAPSRSHPPSLAPAGGVSLETVSELTGWVQIDGCPLSDYTTGPLKWTRLDLVAH